MLLEVRDVPSSLLIGHSWPSGAEVASLGPFAAPSSGGPPEVLEASRCFQSLLHLNNSSALGAASGQSGRRRRRFLRQADERFLSHDAGAGPADRGGHVTGGGVSFRLNLVVLKLLDRSPIGPLSRAQTRSHELISPLLAVSSHPAPPAPPPPRSGVHIVGSGPLCGNRSSVCRPIGPIQPGPFYWDQHHKS